ncbi:hypothetical protein L345_05186, partial [Ophiophagus hannah]
MFSHRWIAWGSQRWRCRTHANRSLCAVQQLGAHEGLNATAVPLSGAQDGASSHGAQSDLTPALQYLADTPHPQDHRVSQPQPGSRATGGDGTHHSHQWLVVIGGVEQGRFPDGGRPPWEIEKAMECSQSQLAPDRPIYPPRLQASFLAPSTFPV